MVVAAKTLTLSALDPYRAPQLIAAAEAAFDKRRAGHTCESRVPGDGKPPLNYRINK